MKVVLRHTMLALQSLARPHSWLSCYSRRALSSCTKRNLKQSGRSQPTARSSLLPARPVASTGGVQYTSRLIFCACGRPILRKEKHWFDSRMHWHVCMYPETKYRQIHTDMHWMQECIFTCIQDQKCISACTSVQDPNTDRYMQLCTGCTSAYAHV